MRMLLTRWLTIVASVGCYLTSLPLPAYYESSWGNAGRTFAGVECLLAPVRSDPFVLVMRPSWWANLLYAVGILALILCKEKAALICGAVASGVALFFLAESYDPYVDQIRPGYWFWLASMTMAAAGSLALLVERRTNNSTT